MVFQQRHPDVEMGGTDGTRRLLGQKVRVHIPAPEGGHVEFVVRILWTCPVGEDLVENGGAFVSVGKTTQG